MASPDQAKKFAKDMTKRFSRGISEWYLKPCAKTKCIYLMVKKEYLKAIVEALFKELGGKLSTISAVEHASFLELIYHFTLCEHGILVNLKVELPKNKPEILSISPMIKGASFIEREVKELFGIEFHAHPNPKRLVLPDNWPKDKHPLRSEYKG